jgi:hypothetical protein
MSRKTPDWYFPPDLLILFVIPIIAILAGVLLPVLSFLKTTDAIILFFTALGTGVMGSMLLFLARLPLYRQRRFWTFGPSALPSLHRKLYWLAYAAIVVALLLLGIVWLRIK